MVGASPSQIFADFVAAPYALAEAGRLDSSSLISVNSAERGSRHDLDCPELHT
jgi:hypothetical protein